MTVSQALEKLSAYEKLMFTYNHASGLMYYDGATVAPRGSADLRADTLGELARLSYALTTAPETVEMLRTLVEARDRLDPVTARKVSELWRDYEMTHRVPEEEFVAYQQLTSKADAVWHEAKERSDFALFEPYLQQVFDGSRRLAEYMQPDKDPYDAQLDRFERGLTRETCDAFFAALRQELVPLIDQVKAHADRVDDAPLHRSFPVAIQREFSDFVMDVMDIDRNTASSARLEHPLHHQLLPGRRAHHHQLSGGPGGLVPVFRGPRGRPRPVRAACGPGAVPDLPGRRRVHGHSRKPVPVL